MDDIIGSIEGNPLLWLFFVSLTLPVRIAMVSRKYLCRTVDDIPAVYPFAESVIRLYTNFFNAELKLEPSPTGIQSRQYESFINRYVDLFTWDRYVI